MARGGVKINRIGQRFGQLLIIGDAPTRFGKKCRPTYWLCKCDCGVVREIGTRAMTTGRAVSCGCYNRKLLLSVNTTHQMSKSREYQIWAKIKNRCTCETNDSYFNYGGRGIKICERWLNSFENFLADMGKSPTKFHTIDRKDNNGNYEPSNCKWATRQEQMNNTRANVCIEYNGETKNIAQWAKALGITYNTLYGQIRQYGKNISDVISDRGYKLAT